MAWTYSDWIQLTGTARLTRLRLHLTELFDALQGGGTSHDGTSYNPTVIQNQIDSLMRTEQGLAAALNQPAFCIPTRRGD